MSDLGKASWIYDDELDMHVPCCSQPSGIFLCNNGPLVGDQIATGDCGEEHTPTLDKDQRISVLTNVIGSETFGRDGRPIKDHWDEQGDTTHQSVTLNDEETERSRNAAVRGLTELGLLPK